MVENLKTVNPWLLTPDAAPDGGKSQKNCDVQISRLGVRVGGKGTVEVGDLGQRGEEPAVSQEREQELLVHAGSRERGGDGFEEFGAAGGPGRGEGGDGGGGGGLAGLILQPKQLDLAPFVGGRLERPPDRGDGFEAALAVRLDERHGGVVKLGAFCDFLLGELAVKAKGFDLLAEGHCLVGLVQLDQKDDLTISSSFRFRGVKPNTGQSRRG